MVVIGVVFLTLCLYRILAMKFHFFEKKKLKVISTEGVVNFIVLYFQWVGIRGVGVRSLLTEPHHCVMQMMQMSLKRDDWELIPQMEH